MFILLGGQILLSIPYVRTLFGAHSFNITAPTIGNSLPPALQKCASPETRPTVSCRPFNLIVCLKLYLLTYFFVTNFDS